MRDSSVMPLTVDGPGGGSRGRGGQEEGRSARGVSAAGGRGPRSPGPTLPEAAKTRIMPGLPADLDCPRQVFRRGSPGFRAARHPYSELEEARTMANSAQARKRARQAEATRQRNASLKSALRTAVKKVRKAIATGDKAAAAKTYAGIAVGDRPHRGQEDRAQEPRLAHQVAPLAGHQGHGAARALTFAASGRPRGGPATCRGASSAPFACGPRGRLAGPRPASTPRRKDAQAHRRAASRGRRCARPALAGHALPPSGRSPAALDRPRVPAPVARSPSPRPSRLPPRYGIMLCPLASVAR